MLRSALRLRTIWSLLKKRINKKNHSSLNSLIQDSLQPRIKEDDEREMFEAA